MRGRVTAALVGVLLLLVLVVPPAGRAVARAPVELLVVSEEPPGWADAAAVHGGGAADAYREQAAIRLWREGRVGRIVALGGPLPHGDPEVTYARAVARRLGQLGVPPEAVMPVDSGGSTVEEVVALRGLAEQQGWRRVVLTTSRWHTRRVALAASQAFEGSKVEWTVLGAGEIGFDAERWWESPGTRNLVLGEWAKIGLGLLFPAEAG